MPAKIEGASHVDLWTAPPERFTIVTTPGRPGYHRRNELTVALDEGLVASIMERGVLESILVGKDGQDLIIIDGRQRVTHAVEANNRRVAAGQPPLKIGFRTTTQPPEKWGLLAEHANIHRPTPVSMQAAIAADLFDAGNATADIAEAMGKKPAYVDGLRRLLGCDRKVIAAADAGIVSPTVAKELADLPRAKQTEALDEMIAKGVTKGAGARKAVAAKKRGAAISVPAAKRARNRTLVEAVVAKLAERRDAEDIGLSATAEAFLNGLRWNAGEEVVPPDDVLEVLAELEAARKHKAA